MRSPGATLEGLAAASLREDHREVDLALPSEVSVTMKEKISATIVLAVVQSPVEKDENGAVTIFL